MNRFYSVTAYRDTERLFSVNAVHIDIDELQTVIHLNKHMGERSVIRFIHPLKTINVVSGTITAYYCNDEYIIITAIPGND